MSIVSLTGATKEGQPLGYGRAPSDDLRPWLARLSVSEVVIPESASIACCILNDHPVIRVLFGARWTAKTADGTFDFAPDSAGQTLCFGPHSKRMPLIVHGSFKVISINFAAGAVTAMLAPHCENTLDRIFDYDELVGHGRLSSRFPAHAAPDAWLDIVEDEFRTFIHKNAVPVPDPLTGAFENACLADPGIAIGAFAAAYGTSTRTLERCIRRDLGLTPKQSLRRARALDMAAMLLGVTMEEEEAVFSSRYFDQSHLIREMRHFFAMTPGQLSNGRHPLLRIGLEFRQSRRLEALARLEKDQPRPWRDPAVEPSGS